MDTSPNRGGKWENFDVTFSTFDKSKKKIVLGTRILDEKELVLKENHKEYDLDTGTVRTFSKGEYEKHNKRYKNLHHININ